jgi:hypothetical protein
MLVELVAISPIVSFDSSQGKRTTACRNRRVIGAGDQKKERESVARGNVSLGMGGSNEVRAREGLAFRPLPEKRG